MIANDDYYSVVRLEVTQANVDAALARTSGRSFYLSHSCALALALSDQLERTVHVGLHDVYDDRTGQVIGKLSVDADDYRKHFDNYILGWNTERPVLPATLNVYMVKGEMNALH